jgi:cysteinyl-tRNA synthetase
LTISPEEIERLIAERAQARKNKDWARADEIRKELSEMCVTLEDTPQGTIWRVKG